MRADLEVQIGNDLLLLQADGEIARVSIRDSDGSTRTAGADGAADYLRQRGAYEAEAKAAVNLVLERAAAALKAELEIASEAKLKASTSGD